MSKVSRKVFENALHSSTEETLCFSAIFSNNHAGKIFDLDWFVVLQGDPTPEPINFFITPTKIKQNNSNFVHSNFWKCWWIPWSQFFIHKIYFISRKKKARIKFMNFSQKYMGLLFLKFFLLRSPCIFTKPCTTGFPLVFPSLQNALNDKNVLKKIR